MGFAYDLTDIGKQLADHNLLMTHWHHVFQDEILEIKYEDVMDDLLTLPKPGFLQDGVTLFQKGDLDGAELPFKKMLHHNPDHSACTYMTGLIYCRKGHVKEGADLMAKALKKASLIK
ncbi:MAG: hypothetical protein JEZ12_14640 [Desulfobacterium sp.]|nr:hypothetical protein [Desulfobacterium sp.]